MTPSRDIGRLLEIMAALRHPGTGCSWDCQQTFHTIAPFTIEEAYEVADAIERGDVADLREELGDLLFQVVYHARLAQEQGSFEFGDVVEAICAKLIRRHPHVFGAGRPLPAAAVGQQWREIKTAEKLDRARSRSAGKDGGALESPGTLADVPRALPSLTRAVKLTASASDVGFDWKDASPVLEKIREELEEVEAELQRGRPDSVFDEIGDLLFAVANLARHAGVDPEAALRRTNQKFIRRFAFIEAALARDGRAPKQATLAEMDGLWNEAKRSERSELSQTPLP